MVETPALTMHDSVHDSLKRRSPLTAGQSLWLQERGLTAFYHRLPGYQQVKHLYSAGFSEEQIIDLVDLDEEEIGIILGQLPSRLPEIVEMTALGYTVLEISEEVGVPRPTVYYHLDDLGIEPVRRRAREITLSQQRKVEQLADMDMPYREIAQRCGLTYDQVRAAVRRSK